MAIRDRHGARGFFECHKFILKVMDLANCMMAEAKQQLVNVQTR